MHSRFCDCALSAPRLRTLDPLTAHSQACDCALTAGLIYTAAGLYHTTVSISLVYA